MRVLAVGAAAAGLVFLGVQAPARAAAPELINFQARLSDAAGDPVGDGDYSVTFSIYDDPAAGALLWSEDQTVTVKDGIFSALLGSVGGFSGGLFDSQVWLGLTVESDNEMTPRFELASAPYALNAHTLDGMHASDLVADLPPVALLTMSQSGGGYFEYSDVTLDASASYDPEGIALEFAWDPMGNGSFTAFAPAVSTMVRTYPSTARAYLPTVRVRDAAGQISESKALVWTGEASQVLQQLMMGGGYVSLAAVDGRPAIAYSDMTDGDLMLTINSDADGSGVWTTTTVDSADWTGEYASLAIVDGRPAISYYNSTNGDLRFAINSQADGSGGWTPYTVDSMDSVGMYTSLAVVNGRPAISYYDSTNTDLKFAINGLADGTGAWSRYTADLDAANSVGHYTSLAVVDGRPAISHFHSTNSDLLFNINSAADGSGTWTRYTVDSAGSVGYYTSLAVVDNRPAISYYDSSNNALKFAINSNVGGTGVWSRYTVDSGGMSTGPYSSLAVVDGKPAISYRGDQYLRFANNSAVDGTGGWAITTVDDGDVQSTSLAVVDGRPAIAYTAWEMAGSVLKFIISP